MYIYFIAAFSLAALACWGLSSILRKRGRNLPLIFFGGLAYILVALPIVWSLYLYFALGFIGIGVLFMALSTYSLPAKLQAPLVALPIVSLHSKYFFVDKFGKRTPITEDAEPQTVAIQGLWTLGAERTGDTGIDFIVDIPVADTDAYKTNEKEKWQREIDSCSQNR